MRYVLGQDVTYRMEMGNLMLLTPKTKNLLILKHDVSEKYETLGYFEETDFTPGFIDRLKDEGALVEK